MKFVIDEEIVLKNDGSERTDLLNTSVYANMLVKTIESADNSKPFTIGLFGEWGSGKSSVLKTAQNYLEARPNSQYRFVTYDAWKYAGDSFRRMFLYELQNKLGVKPTEMLQRFYDNINEDTEVTHETNTHYWLYWTLVLFIAGLILVCDKDVLKYWGFGFTTITALITIVLNLKKNSTDDLKITVQKSRLFAPEQFEECFNEIIEGSRKKPSALKKVWNWINGVEKKSEKLVIVIDNIDRCHNDMAYSLLTDIKNFLGCKQQHLIFVIPVDVDALKKHIINKSKSSAEECNQADEFLRKFFNVSLWIKPFHSDEMFEFAENLNSKYELGLQRETLSIMAREYATNPRRLIQLCNNLIIEFESFEDIYYVRDNQPIICKMVIMREEFPNYYKKIQHDATLLFSDKFDKIDNDRMKLFLQRTFYVSKPYEFRLSIIDRILSNSKTSGSLTSAIKEQISIPGSVEEINAFIANDETRRKDVVAYLLSEIRKAANRKLFNADMVNLYPAFLYLYTAGIIKDEECRMLGNLISSESDWGILIPLISDYLEMHIPFSHHMCKLGNEQPRDSFIQYVSSWNEDDSFSVPVRHSVFHACNEYGAECIDDLVKPFHKAFKEDPTSSFAFRYPEASSLFTNDLVSEVIEEMKSDNVNGSESPYTQFRMICSQLEPKKDDPFVLKFFEKLHTLIPEYNYQSSNADDIFVFMEYLKEFFQTNSKIRLSDNSNLNTTLSKMTNTHRVGSTLHSYLYDNDENAQIIVNFFNLFEMAGAITNAPTIDEATISHFANMKDWCDKTIEVLDNLLTNGFDVSHYREAIIAVESYSDAHLRLISYLCSDSCPTERRLNNITLREQISNILTQMESSEVDHSDFLVKEANGKEWFKEQLLVYLEGKPVEYLAQLDSKLQRFVVKKFEEKLNDYEHNVAILTLIATSGTKNGIHKLVNLISTKLIQGDNSLNWCSLMSKIREINQRELNLLSSTIENLSDSSLSDEDKAGMIETLKSKLKV